MQELEEARAAAEKQQQSAATDSEAKVGQTSCRLLSSRPGKVPLQSDRIIWLSRAKSSIRATPPIQYESIRARPSIRQQQDVSTRAQAKESQE